MNNTIIATKEPKELAQQWRALTEDVKKNKKIKVDIFDEVFTKTYSTLAMLASEKSIDKCYVEMIAEAYLFANIKDETLDYNCLAAFVLTERMLTYCAFNSSADLDKPSSIYIVEARKEILLDFNDVGESISKLARVFESIFWKK